MMQEAGMADRSERAIAIMSARLPEARKVSRVHLTLPASVTCHSLNVRDHLAILRDLSTAGAFFYSEMEVIDGTSLMLQFTLTAFGKNIRLACEGKIVRVERFPRGAATGIAVEFSRCDMSSADIGHKSN